MGLPENDRTEHLRALADHEPTDYWGRTDIRVEDVPDRKDVEW